MPKSNSSIFPKTSFRNMASTTLPRMATSTSK
eukprot:CCRYP_010934-RE/>CCRYP_010934-RE protein AED:0.49 eAED:0.49 QI:0/-1/0/1/-1/0/1/0/31